MAEPWDKEPQNENNLTLTGTVTDDITPQGTDPAGEAIGMEARIRFAGVSIRVEGKPTDAEKRAIREKAKQHCNDHVITRAELARQIGKAPSTVSEVLKGKYNSDKDTHILLDINAWLDIDTRRRKQTPLRGFHTTRVFEAIQALAMFAKSNSTIAGTHPKAAVEVQSARIAVGWGPAGCGKSTGASALHRADGTSLLVRIGQSKGTDKGLAKLILDAGGWRGKPSSNHVGKFIEDKLKGSGRLVIIDEAHRIRFSGCELIRDLADVCGIPILMLGTSELYQRLTGVRTQSGNLCYDQFSRRVGAFCELIRGIDGKGGSEVPIFSFEEIKAIFTPPKLRITPDAIGYLQAVACTIGSGMLGEAANIFDLARRACQSGSRVIDEVLVRGCAKKAFFTPGGIDDGILAQIDQTDQVNRAMQSKAMQV